MSFSLPGTEGVVTVSGTATLAVDQPRALICLHGGRLLPTLTPVGTLSLGIRLDSGLGRLGSQHFLAQLDNARSGALHVDVLGGLVQFTVGVDEVTLELDLVGNLLAIDCDVLKRLTVNDDRGLLAVAVTPERRADLADGANDSFHVFLLVEIIPRDGGLDTEARLVNSRPDSRSCDVQGGHRATKRKPVSDKPQCLSRRHPLG